MPDTALRRLPLVPGAVSWACGIAAAHTLSPPKTVFVVTSLLVAALIAWWRPRRGTRAQLLLFAAPFLLGIFAATPRWEPADSERALTEITGVVVGPPRPVRGSRLGRDPRATPPKRRRAQLQVVRGPEALRGRIVTIVTADQPRYGRGDQLTITGWLDGAVLWATAVPPIVHRSGSATAFFDRTRAAIRHSWGQRFGALTTGWWSALLLGDRALLPESVIPRFRRVGLSHLVAISGMHVGILASLLLLPLRRWRIGRARTSAIAVTIALLAYAALVGTDAPVLRAVLLAACACVATVRGRNRSLANPLAAVFLLVCAMSDGRVVAPGLLLSFCAVAAIAMLPPAPARTVRSSRLRRALQISIAACWGASVPLVWWSPEVVPWGPFATLLLLPLLTIVLATGLLSLLPGTALFDRCLEWIASLAIGALDTATVWLDHLPATPTCWPALRPLSLALLLAAAGGFLLGHRYRRLAPAILLLAVLPTLAPPPRTGGELVPLGRGQGLLLVGPRATVLYDAGSADAPNGGSAAIRRALRRYGRMHVDLLVLSHPHADHMNAVLSLLRDVSLGTVVVGPRFADVPLGEQCLRHLRARGCEPTTVLRGDQIVVGGWQLDVLHPRAKPLPGAGINDDSVVVRVTGHGLDLLLCGDLEATGMASNPLPRDLTWLLLPHHGRFTAGLDRWLEASPPTAALAATARRLPHDTHQVLLAAGVPYVCTGRQRRVWLRRTEDGWTAIVDRR